MNVCPICLYVNKPDAGLCSRCGKFRFPSVAVAVMDPPTPVAGDEARTKVEGSGSVLTKPSGTVSVIQTSRPPAEAEGNGQVGFALPKRETAGSGSSPSTGGASASGTPTTRVVVKPRLEVVRGEKLGAAFPVLEGRNIVGRMVNSPVDIDLTGQEPPERVWTSRQHACVIFDGKAVILEDMNSLNGTFVNRQRVFPGQQRVLQPNDVVQIGTVQLRMLVSAETVANG
jgi:pSer/pThr/pTyr-binding forkhead associated (FHA) protein